MFRLFKIELKRAVTGRGMIISMLLGIGCVIYKHYLIYLRIQNSADVAKKMGMFIYEEFQKLTFYDYSMVSVMEVGTLYMFYFFGLIVALPFGISYYRDSKIGVIKNISIRSGKKEYLKAKYAAVFVSGGMAVSIPLVIDFMIAKLWVPIDFVRIQGTSLQGVTTRWNMFIVDHIYISACIFVILWFLFGGALATVSLFVSTAADNFFTIQLTPFFVMLALFYLPQFLPKSCEKFFPFYFLTKFSDSNPLIAVAVSCLFVCFTYTLFMKNELKKDIL